MPRIQPLSVMRAGSTYVIRVLELNFDAELPQTIRRHIFDFSAFDAPVLLITRDPYSWLPSFHRMRRARMGQRSAVTGRLQEANDIPESLAEFARSPWSWDEPLYDPCSPEVAEPLRYASPLDYWTECHRTALAAIEGGAPVRHVRWESFLEDFDGAMLRIAGLFDLTPTRAAYQDITEEVRERRGRFDERRRRYYLDREYLALYAPEDLTHINGRLDRGLLREFGYDTEEKALRQRRETL